MRLRKELLAVFYVIILLLNDRQMMFAQDLSGLLELEELRAYAVTEAFSGTSTGGTRLIYEMNGGYNDPGNPVWLPSEEFPVTLGVPVREGYNFAGWYTDSHYRHKVTEITGEEDSVILFAKWTGQIDNIYNVEMYAYQSANALGGDGKQLRDLNYAFLDVQIPGMPSTREQDYLANMITSEKQCLQGICFTPDYILMTSYAEGRSDPGCLLVLDRESGAYLVTLDMKEESHLGGIAYDGENVWVCHSDSNTLERIPYEYIRQIAADAPGCCVDVSPLTAEYRVRNSPSCITCYGGRIWVATHTKFFDSAMCSYRYSKEEDRLVYMSSYAIPSKVQGVAFDGNGSVYLSTSYGRNNSSYLKVYSSLLALSDNPGEPSCRVEMPPCSEEIAIVEDQIYIVFESASRKYFEGTDGKGTSASPIDQILEISTASVW